MLGVRIGTAVLGPILSFASGAIDAKNGNNPDVGRIMALGIPMVVGAAVGGFSGSFLGPAGTVAGVVGGTIIGAAYGVLDLLSYNLGYNLFK